ncbi:MAG: hypothetical protein PHQ34_12610 [Methanothrix sp.]|nr:hypothetical protein [Methanothrix sp.]
MQINYDDITLQSLARADIQGAMIDGTLQKKIEEIRSMQNRLPCA